MSGPHGEFCGCLSVWKTAKDLPEPYADIVVKVKYATYFDCYHDGESWWRHDCEGQLEIDGPVVWRYMDEGYVGMGCPNPSRSLVLAADAIGIRCLAT